MVTNYCDLPKDYPYSPEFMSSIYIVNSSRWMDNMYNRYLQAVISLLDILEHYGIEITIHSYFIFLMLFSGK